ncbi:2'-5' RNA ligase [Jatrophihabitans endophyticus]|uniref:2'-5' RNA ligase n=1 Tax=Jatrophihabitans endophyticus TaxID=1206085 RepID=A0A1M5SYB7_9ACTN|nr:2'-5' RNA ligase family protein [Jatrophihabitans endophyticus]SHH43328.1 2'-5' RNA ligase [Jatrophihabitans endophyticus]
MRSLVVTVRLDDETQQRFERERARWFPAGRTQVGAHVTLFHAVPGELRDDVETDLHDVTGPPFDVAVTGVRSLGRGAAYVLHSDELTRRHATLQRAWWPHLTRQDRQPFRAHVTVQNKVDPATARRTVAELQAAFAPFPVAALGWSLWRYDGGPWTHLIDVPFR